MMYHIPGVLNADEVAQFRAQLDQAPWIDGRATVGNQGAQVKITSRSTRKVRCTPPCRRRCCRR